MSGDGQKCNAQERVSSQSTGYEVPLSAASTRSLDGGPSFSVRNRLLRVAWKVTWLLLGSWTPPHMHPWRRILLRLFGAQMSGAADVRGSARVWYPPHLTMADKSLIAANVRCYNMAPVTLGRGALVSQNAHLCAGSHDIDDPDFQLVVHPIRIEDGAWVAADAFVGPGVTIGRRAVVGARGVVMRDVPAGRIAVGNPSRLLDRIRKEGLSSPADTGA